MISANFEEVLKSFDDLISTFEKKAEGMVQKFAAETIYRISSKSPLGNLNSDGAVHFYTITRPFIHSPLVLQPEPGFSKGSWRLSFVDDTLIQESYGSHTEEDAKRKAFDVGSRYKIGQPVYILNTGPYIKNLEAGKSKQAPSGFKPIAIPIIQEVYKVDAARHFQES